MSKHFTVGSTELHKHHNTTIEENNHTWNYRIQNEITSDMELTVTTPPTRTHPIPPPRLQKL